MAIDLYSDNNSSVVASPRISFSQDFPQTDCIPVEQHPTRSNSRGLNSSFDFDFCVRESFDGESSSADELFSGGKILPIQLKTTAASNPPPLPPPQALPIKNLKKQSYKEGRDNPSDAEEKQSSKSFWRFKRSSSCGSGYGRSLCPLPLLSRSYSTGSTPNSKRAPFSKEGQNLKQTSYKSSSMKSLQGSPSMGYNQKPPLKKSHCSYGNSVKVIPVLNVHSGNLFGLGSIFSSIKDKSNKK